MNSKHHVFAPKIELEELNPISEKIIKCAYTVSNQLGAGFTEKVYENALAHELRKAEMGVSQQYPMKVLYDGILVGEFVADILVDEKILIELKAVKALENVHKAQCINYLKATGLRLCLLINFGNPRVEINRIVY